MTVELNPNLTFNLTALDGGGFDSRLPDGTPVDPPSGPSIAMEPASYFSDDFSSGDWNKQRPGGGNFWRTMQFSSIVTNNAGQNTVLYNGAVVNNDVNDGRDFTGLFGGNSLRQRYNAGQNDNSKAQWLILDPQTEIYIGWWLRVPTNFRKAGSNNKFIWLWMDGRSDQGNGSTVGMEYRGTDSANWYVKVGAGSDVVGGDQGSVPFISYPSDQGRWMCVVFGSKVESSPGANDGWVKVWRAWEDESSFTNTHNITGQPIKLPDNPADPQGFVECEMMGYPNGPFAEDTEWLIQDVRISATPLVPVGTPGL